MYFRGDKRVLAGGGSPTADVGHCPLECVQWERALGRANTQSLKPEHMCICWLISSLGDRQAPVAVTPEGGGTPGRGGPGHPACLGAASSEVQALGSTQSCHGRAGRLCTRSFLPYLMTSPQQPRRRGRGTLQCLILQMRKLGYLGRCLTWLVSPGGRV